MPPLDSLSIFNAQPGATLLLSPDWVIMGASDDYLAATLTERAVIVGQHIFDAFPDNPATPEAKAVANVRASLETVLATKQPHNMAPQHYDVPDRTRPGGFVERHWQPRHTPVLDAQGQVQFIIQSVQDIADRPSGSCAKAKPASKQLGPRSNGSGPSCSASLPRRPSRWACCAAPTSSWSGPMSAWGGFGAALSTKW
jgi:hypothetical protein